MDKQHAMRILERLQAEQSVHEEKFASNALHKNCQPRFDRIIGALKQELGRCEVPRLDFATNESALPDALFAARMFMNTASEMALEHEDDAAELMHLKAVEVVMNELNELDGFAR